MMTRTLNENRWLPKNLILLSLTLLLLGCTPTVGQPPAAGDRDGGKNILADYPLGSVELRLQNSSEFDLETITLRLDDESFSSGPLAAGDISGPMMLPYLTHTFEGSVTVDGTTYEHVPLDDLTGSGIQPINAGIYTFEVTFIDEESGSFSINLRPEVELARARLTPLIRFLQEGGGQVRYEPFIQQPNVFSMGNGDKNSATELFQLRNNSRLMVFIFADEPAAVAASKRVNLGTDTVRVSHQNGTESDESVDFWFGDQPVWWQYSNVIFLTDGRDNTAYELVNHAVGDYPLGGPKAEFVPTATPDTPVLAGDIYMARRNFDPDACNAALLTGTLVVENGCFYVQGDNVADKFLVVWPRTYSIDESGLVPAVIGSDGEVVFKVGDRAYLGGSGIPADSPFMSENLISPVPDRCEVQEVWGMCSYTPEEYRDEAVNTFEHAAVYGAVIDQLFDGSQADFVPIRFRTGREGVPGYLPNGVAELDSLSAETIAEYHRVNAGAKDIEQAFPDQDRYRMAWETEEFETGIAIHFSDVGFNTDRTQALVWAVNDCGDFSCREDFYVVLNKGNGGWQVGDSFER